MTQLCAFCNVEQVELTLAAAFFIFFAASTRAWRISSNLFILPFLRLFLCFRFAMGKGYLLLGSFYFIQRLWLSKPYKKEHPQNIFLDSVLPLINLIVNSYINLVFRLIYWCTGNQIYCELANLLC